MKILNLYAGIGGNRKLWTPNGDDHEITAVEYNQEIANIYKDYFPNDTVIVADAHEYLLKHYNEYDFIWSSPPCPTHSKINTDGQRAARYPDMALYQEIIMLGNNWFKGKWVIENVIPYYIPLIHPTRTIGRHHFWANFRIGSLTIKKEKSIKDTIPSLPRYGFTVKDYRIKHRKDTILRNLVDPEIGLYILNRALDIKSQEQTEQKTLFDD